MIKNKNFAFELEFLKSYIFQCQIPRMEKLYPETKNDKHSWKENC